MDDPRPPAIPAPTLEPFLTIEKDGANVQTLKLASHTGTHVDAPLHIVEGGISINEFVPEELIYTKPVVIDLRLTAAKIVMPKHLNPYANAISNADIALFRFGTGKIRRSDPKRFALKSPGLGVEAAKWLRESFPSLRAMGMDVPSLACIDSLDETMAAHNILLGGKGRRFLIIEDMNLEHNLPGLREVRINPWLVSGMDSGPCTVIGVME